MAAMASALRCSWARSKRRVALERRSSLRHQRLSQRVPATLSFRRPQDRLQLDCCAAAWCQLRRRTRQLHRRVPPVHPPCHGRVDGDSKTEPATRKLVHPARSSPRGPRVSDRLQASARWPVVPLLLPRLSAAAERMRRRTPRSGGSAEPLTGSSRLRPARGWRVIDTRSRRRISPSQADQGGGPACGGSSRR
jgi:hypothetical protein